MGKMDGMSMDLLAENIAQLKMLFPEAVTEGKVDFEVLKALLGGEIEKRQEYYKFTWNGKEAARAYARTRSMGTLRPCVEESSGKDGTPGKFDSDNLYIEGDNLEVLKLLQGPYHKRVKMIYIDPPYNTGKDFVYPDNFKDSIGNYKALTGQTDDEGKSTRANPETSGRYHTDWLNMMYPRLILARNLLTDDGVIFISIDDNEQTNMKKLGDEIFGEENFITTICWQKFHSVKSNSEGNISKSHDFILVYAKSVEFATFIKLPMSEKALEVYKNPDNDPRGRWRTAPLTVSLLTGARGEAFKRTGKSNGLYPIISPTGKEHYPTPGRCWFAKDTIDALQKDNRIWWGKDGNSVPMQKVFLSETGGVKAITTFWDHETFGSNKLANEEIKLLFPDNTQETANFPTPKPTLLLSTLVKICCSDDNAIILDFFSGSGSTADAILQINNKDDKNYRYIMVQLPEEIESGKYTNICEIGKERIRRAAKKIKGEHPEWNGDMGFKVFKLDTSNLLPWNPNADELEQNLFAAVDNVLEGRSTDDLLYEVMLKCNLPLTLPIEKKQCGNNTIYLVGAGALAICLDKAIPATIAEEIVKLRDEYAPIVPMQVVFRDNGFNDVTKTNALQILKQAGFEEKSIQTI